jgi:glycogen operon protein
MGDLGFRLTGSSDLYADDGRSPIASINFVTCHDGFTLNDLVSYNSKHNEQNGEDNRDGTDDNRSWNCGEEGPTLDPEILELRERQKRNMLTTLFLSQGVPMLSHGDELGRTQLGDNNGYCQDNELTWVRWDAAKSDTAARGLAAFVRKLTDLHAAHPVFRRRRFFHGKPVREARGALSDIVWFTQHGREMEDEDWADGEASAITVFLNGEAIDEPNRRGQPVHDESFLLVFNAEGDDRVFALPPWDYGSRWLKVLDTNDPLLDPDTGTPIKSGETFRVASRSIQVLCRA